MHRTCTIFAFATTATIAALAFVGFTGCGDSDTDGYETSTIYPPRIDPLVNSLKNVPPPNGLPPVGKLNESIASLQSRGGDLVHPSKLTPADQTALSNALVDLFGSPAEPKIDTPAAVREGLTPERLAAGSRVYKRHCVQCHGMNGDGRGPTSLWVHPPARDFRQATFKYVSTPDGFGWPTRADILRGLLRGIGGNSMPSFAMLREDELHAVTDYTLHLMFRGKVEFEVINRILSPDPPDNIARLAKQRLEVNLEEWQRAIAPAIETMSVPVSATEPTANPAAIRRAHDLFKSEKAGCITCHVDYGRRAVLRYDVWGVVVKPAALTEGQHRGGSDPLDLFRRLKCGIPGATMPPMSQFTDAELWDLVAFLRALPDPKNLPDDVRNAVYPGIR